MDEFPTWMWDAVDPTHAMRDVLDDPDSSGARYMNLWGQMLRAVHDGDNDRLDEILEPLTRDELMILVVWITFGADAALKQAK
jgi:hypothetical protein